MNTNVDGAPTNITAAVPFFQVSNMEESVRYYIDGLGFEMSKRWVVDGTLRWCWLEHGKASIMLQEFPREGHDSWAAEGTVGEGVSICFICEDALVIYRQIKSRGIRASRPVVGNGMWVTSLRIPTATGSTSRATLMSRRRRSPRTKRDEAPTSRDRIPAAKKLLAISESAEQNYPIRFRSNLGGMSNTA